AQRRWVETPAFARHLDRTVARLRGAAAGDLPADRPRPPARSYRGGLCVRRIPLPLVDRLRAIAAGEEASLFASLLAALQILIAPCTGQRDVVVMVPVAGRLRYRAEGVIGFFANMAVLRREVPGHLPYRALVRRAGAELVAGALARDVPFEKVVEALRP